MCVAAVKSLTHHIVEWPMRYLTEAKKMSIFEDGLSMVLQSFSSFLGCLSLYSPTNWMLSATEMVASDTVSGMYGDECQ